MTGVNKKKWRKHYLTRNENREGFFSSRSRFCQQNDLSMTILLISQKIINNSLTYAQGHLVKDWSSIYNFSFIALANNKWEMSLIKYSAVLCSLWAVQVWYVYMLFCSTFSIIWTNQPVMCVDVRNHANKTERTDRQTKV